MRRLTTAVHVAGPLSKTSVAADARVIAFTVIAMAAVSCGGSSPVAPGPGTSPSPPRFTVSGTVFEIAGSDRRPLPGTDIQRWIEQEGGAALTRVATTDAEGRYSLADVPSGTRLALVVDRGLLPCPAVATVAGDLVLDIDVLKSAFDPSPRISPTLSGLVFHTVDGARRPYRDGAGISFFSSSFAGGHVYLASVVTDDDGRFELCRLPAGPATLSVVTFDGTATKQINVQGDAVVEVEVVPTPPPSPPGPDIDGTYSLRFDASCTAIPPELRSRTYTAIISGSPNFVARLSGSNFRQDATDGLLNAFSGSTTANPDRVALDLHWPPSTERWGIVEQITSTSFLEIVGRGTGVISGSVIDGTINGGIGFGEDLRDDGRHTGCAGPIRFQMTRR